MNFTIIYNLVLLIIIFIILSIFIYNLYVENFENSFSDNSSSNVSDILNEDEELQLLNSANDNPFVLDIDNDPYNYEESHNHIDGFQSRNNSFFDFFSFIGDFFDTFYKNIIVENFNDRWTVTRNHSASAPANPGAFHGYGRRKRYNNRHQRRRRRALNNARNAHNQKVANYNNAKAAWDKADKEYNTNVANAKTTKNKYEVPYNDAIDKANKLHTSWNTYTKLPGSQYVNTSPQLATALSKFHAKRNDKRINKSNFKKVRKKIEKKPPSLSNLRMYSHNFTKADQYIKDETKLRNKEEAIRQETIRLSNLRNTKRNELKTRWNRELNPLYLTTIGNIKALDRFPIAIEEDLLNNYFKNTIAPLKWNTNYYTSADNQLTNYINKREASIKNEKDRLEQIRLADGIKTAENATAIANRNIELTKGKRKLQEKQLKDLEREFKNRQIEFEKNRKEDINKIDANFLDAESITRKNIGKIDSLDRKFSEDNNSKNSVFDDIRANIFTLNKTQNDILNGLTSFDNSGFNNFISKQKFI